MLIAGRVLNGVCVGITSSQVPVYLAELAKKDKRGSLVIIQQLAIGMFSESLPLDQADTRTQNGAF